MTCISVRGMRTLAVMALLIAVLGPIHDTRADTVSSSVLMVRSMHVGITSILFRGTIDAQFDLDLFYQTVRSGRGIRLSVGKTTRLSTQDLGVGLRLGYLNY